jgi:hypothetical protein
MGRRLDENLGTVGFDNLIASMYPPAEVFHVELRAGQGLLGRGTLLARKDDGTMEMISTDTTGKANAILAEPADTGAPVVKAQADGEQAATLAEAETVFGIAYRTGHFNTNRLIVAEDYTITAADKEALRVAGILTSEAVEI